MFDFVKKIFSRRRKTRKEIDVTQRYYSFKNLLLTNNELLDLFSRLQKELNKFYLNVPVVRSLIIKILDTTFFLIQNLNEFTDNKYQDLYEVFIKLDRQIRANTNRLIPESKLLELAIPLYEADVDLIALVGGKAAHLGEVRSYLNLPVPSGFVLTTTAFKRFIEHNNYKEIIEEKIEKIELNDLEAVNEASLELTDLIRKGDIPNDIKEAIEIQWQRLQQKSTFSGIVAVRSSAYGEDSQFSFAGQFKSVLGVKKDKLLEAYKEVIASKYSPRAIVYRMQKRIKDEEMPMAVLIIEMVNAKAAGVIYTRDPRQPQEDKMLITSYWGLGEYVVSGKVSTDYFWVSRIEDEIEAHIAHKEVMLVLEIDGIKEKPVPLDLKDKSSLTESEISLLKQYGLIIEGHFNAPQDIEYAVNKEGVYILQTRPLNILRVLSHRFNSPAKPLLKGISVSLGVASGPVFILDGKSLSEVPEGTILVTKHTSPELAALIPRVLGIITDLGNPSGHMATVAREEGIPAVLNTLKATSLLRDGQIVTIDGNNGVVYDGRVEDILKTGEELKPKAVKRGESENLKKTLELILPLTLLDPRSPQFRPQSCKTIHDIIRFIHEVSIQEMFNLSDKVASSKRMKVVRLISHLPVPVFIIDLGGGINKSATEAKVVKPEQITSIPFKALWQGMSHPKVRWSGPVGVNIQGFIGVLMRSMAGAEGNLGEPSYAIISKEYMNFNIRLAYHYSLVDAFCSEIAANNYINFRFFGGGASADRRSLRAKCIEEILKYLGFSVIREADLINAWFKKYPLEITKEKLEILGRLMGFTRQLDMLMENEDVCYIYADIFKKGEYDLIYKEDFLEKIRKIGDRSQT